MQRVVRPKQTVSVITNSLSVEVQLCSVCGPTVIFSHLLKKKHKTVSVVKFSMCGSNKDTVMRELPS